MSKLLRNAKVIMTMYVSNLILHMLNYVSKINKKKKNIDKSIINRTMRFKKLYSYKF